MLRAPGLFLKRSSFNRSMNMLKELVINECSEGDGTNSQSIYVIN